MTIADTVNHIAAVLNFTLSDEESEAIGAIIDLYGRERALAEPVRYAPGGFRESAEPATAIAAKLASQPRLNHASDRFRIRTLAGVTVEVDAMDALAAVVAGQDISIAFALKHLLHAGRRPGSSQLENISKAVEWLQRLLPEEKKS